MADKLVCVGGPADGSSRSVTDSCRRIDVLVRRSHSFQYPWRDAPPNEIVAVETAVYRREKIQVGAESVEFLCYAEMSPIAAVRKLLEDHRP